jgi:hypothetical protein
MNELQYFDFHKKEAQAERDAVPFVCGYSFSDCLRINGIKPDIMVRVKDRKGDITIEKIEAYTVYGSWEKYLKETEQVTGKTTTKILKSGKEKTELEVVTPIILINNVETHIEKMYTWLTTQYTDRYKSITKDEDQDWLKTIIRVTVLRRIMKNKFYSQRDTGNGFMDITVYESIKWIFNVDEAKEEIAKLSHKGCYDGVSKAIQLNERINAELKEKEILQDIATSAAVEAVREILPSLIETLVKHLPLLEKGRFTMIEGGNAANE